MTFKLCPYCNGSSVPEGKTACERCEVRWVVGPISEEVAAGLSNEPGEIRRLDDRAWRC